MLTHADNPQFAEQVEDQKAVSALDHTSAHNLLTDADKQLTDADKLLKDADKLLTHADKWLTHADKPHFAEQVEDQNAASALDHASAHNMLTDADKQLTDADKLLTDADRLLTHADQLLTHADEPQFAEQVEDQKAASALDHSSAHNLLTDADKQLTDADKLLTVADRLLTHAVKFLTHADKPPFAEQVEDQKAASALDHASAHNQRVSPPLNP